MSSAASASAASASGTTPAPVDRPWYIVGRWQEFEGEGRANLLRVLALAAFYCVQLVDHHFFQEHTADERQFHQAVTAIAAGWSLLALGIHVCLRRHVFPASLKYVSTGADLLFLTALLWVGNGPASPLVFVYFPIVALSALRFSLPLVRFATLAAMTLFLVVVGAKDSTWFDSQHDTPVVQQLVVLLSLGVAGIVAGQVIRRVRGMAEDYARRLQGPAGGAS